MRVGSSRLKNVANSNKLAPSVTYTIPFACSAYVFDACAHNGSLPFTGILILYWQSSMPMVAPFFFAAQAAAFGSMVVPLAG